MTLYLLISGNAERFKIGRTEYFSARHSALKSEWGKFDLAHSYAVEGDSESICRLEKLLHWTFANWNTPIERGGGVSTEWFDLECLPQVVAQIENIVGLRAHSPLSLRKGILLPSHSRKSTPSSHLKHRETLQERQELRRIENESSLATLETWMPVLINHLIGRVLSTSDSQHILLAPSDELTFDRLFENTKTFSNYGYDEEGACGRMHVFTSLTHTPPDEFFRLGFSPEIVERLAQRQNTRELAADLREALRPLVEAPLLEPTLHYPLVS